jgi:hypothetical protein
MIRTLLPELHSEEARKALSVSLMAVLDRWQLFDPERLVLLGLSDTAALMRYRKGEPLADEPKLLERAGHLLAIERVLRRRYPYQPALRRGWIKQKDAGLGDRSPLEVIEEQGLEGLRAVREHLDRPWQR